MSRIGKSPIIVPKGVTVTIEGNKVTCKGPKGTLSQDVSPSIKVVFEGDKIVLTRSSEVKEVKSMHGLYRALIANMVHGVTEGFFKNLEITGVGYRATKDGKKLMLAMGYSHPVAMEPPAGVDFVLEGQTKIKVTGIDKQMVGKMALDIKNVRPVEPYKGKGIRYQGQYVRRKAGKAAVKAGG